ncbi:hypothetical protein [Bellilinea sp.]
MAGLAGSAGCRAACRLAGHQPVFPLSFSNCLAG